MGWEDSVVLCVEWDRLGHTALCCVYCPQQESASPRSGLGFRTACLQRLIQSGTAAAPTQGCTVYAWVSVH